MSDNKFNKVMSSAKNVAEKISETAEEAKSTALKIKDNAVAKQEERKASIAEKKRLNDIKKYSPIFIEDVKNGELVSERFIRIINYNSRLENETCKDSIGFYEKTKDRKLPTLYTGKVRSLGLTFYPNLSESVFVADPCVEGKYIEIDEYYDYMKQVRANELTVLAQALGAKSVRIELRNTSKSQSDLKIDANAKAEKIAKGNFNHDKKIRSSKSIEIWAETTFKTSIFNGNPTTPQLMYFRNESDIEALIQMVTINKSKLTMQNYTMKASSSSRISLSEAANISATLKLMKCKAGANFKKSAKKENNSFLHYIIIF